MATAGTDRTPRFRARAVTDCSRMTGTPLPGPFRWRLRISDIPLKKPLLFVLTCFSILQRLLDLTPLRGLAPGLHEARNDLHLHGQVPPNVNPRPWSKVKRCNGNSIGVGRCEIVVSHFMTILANLQRKLHRLATSGCWTALACVTLHVCASGENDARIDRHGSYTRLWSCRGFLRD